MKPNSKENLIVSKTFKFAIDIIEYTEMLNARHKFVIANQLLKSGTSIGANTREAQNAESRRDFIHKFKIAAKEADETEYWLELCKESKNYPYNDQLIKNLHEIQRIISKIIISSKKISTE